MVPRLSAVLAQFCRPKKFAIRRAGNVTFVPGLVSETVTVVAAVPVADTFTITG